MPISTKVKTLQVLITLLAILAVVAICLSAATDLAGRHDHETVTVTTVDR